MSQIVGTQAVLNVLTGKRWQVVPDEMKAYLRGKYGKAPGPINPDIMRRVLGDEQPITGRPADLIDETLEQYREEIGDSGPQRGGRAQLRPLPQRGPQLLRAPAPRGRGGRLPDRRGGAETEAAAVTVTRHRPGAGAHRRGRGGRRRRGHRRGRRRAHHRPQGWRPAAGGGAGRLAGAAGRAEAAAVPAGVRPQPDRGAARRTALDDYHQVRRAHGGHVLRVAVADQPGLRRGGPARGRGRRALHPRSDEAHERGHLRGQRDRPGRPRRGRRGPWSTASRSSPSSSTRPRRGRPCSAASWSPTGARSPSASSAPATSWAWRPCASTPRPTPSRCTSGRPTHAVLHRPPRPPPELSLHPQHRSPRPRSPAARPSTPVTASSPRTRTSRGPALDNDLVFIGPDARQHGRPGGQVPGQAASWREAGLPTIPGSEGTVWHASPRRCGWPTRSATR